MKLFSCFALAFVTAFALESNAESDSTFVYSNTRICSNLKHGYCLSYDKRKDLVVLDRKHRLRFEVETIEGVNMDINRVYTYAVDKATRKKVKSCLVKRDILDRDAAGLSLAPCDTDENELVLALNAAGKEDEFVLRELTYMEKEGSSDPLCLSMTHTSGEHLEVATQFSDIHRRSPVTLEKCSEATAVGQDFTARFYDRSVSTGVSSVADETKQIGRFCLLEKQELCIGLSLTNGTILEKNKFVQIKNLTKNQAKDLDSLKMEWYWDTENQRIAAAAEMDFCLEAIYGAPIGENRPGIEQFDDIVHLGACDPSRSAELADEGFRGYPASEFFYPKEVSSSEGNYIELRTDVPLAARPEGAEGTVTKCVSVVKCVRHEFGQCTKYNSRPVYEVEDLEQGSYVRLKDCDSENMPSQRFKYSVDSTITMPPTKTPTPPPESTAAPTPYPTAEPTTGAPTLPPSTASPTTEVTSAPTQSPIPSGGQLPPTDDGQSVDDRPQEKGAALTAALAIVGVLCLAVIVVGVIYYYKHKGEFQELPEEDENFIARV